MPGDLKQQTVTISLEDCPKQPCVYLAEEAAKDDLKMLEGVASDGVSVYWHIGRLEGLKSNPSSDIVFEFVREILATVKEFKTREEKLVEALRPFARVGALPSVNRHSGAGLWSECDGESPGISAKDAIKAANTLVELGIQVSK